MSGKESLSVEERVEVPAAWLAEMEASQAGTGTARAAWIEWTAVLAVDHRCHEGVQFGLEDRLKTAENEVPARRSIDEEAEMTWDQVLGERIPINPGVDGGAPDQPMRVRVDES